MLPYIAEFLGTMMLILLGDGVVANVTLNKSGMKGAGSIQITFAWGLAVMIPAFIFGAASGASFNPALTIALAVEGSFAWGMVPGYTDKVVHHPRKIEQEQAAEYGKQTVGQIHVKHIAAHPLVMPDNDE